MKITYYYKEYKDFPEATRISESRAFVGLILGMLSVCFLGLSIIWLFAFPEDFVQGIICTLLAVAACVYMFKRYPQITEKKIARAIYDSATQKERLAASKYLCRSISVSEECIQGMCNVCYEKNRNLRRCKIKQCDGTRNIFVCGSCIAKFQNQFGAGNDSDKSSEPPRPESMTQTKRSSSVEAVQHKDGDFYIKLRSGGFYLYKNFPRSVYLQMMNSPSMGDYYRQHIEGKYPSIRL